MEREKKYHGVVVPMVTPLTADGDIDTPAVERIVSNFVRHDVSPLIMGTTGEGNSVSTEQGVKMVKAAKKVAGTNTIIYCGLAGNCISDQFKAARAFTEAGADVIAATLPSYYALTNSQMCAYYENLANRLEIPLMIYNITITTHMSIPLEVILRLSQHPNIVGLKDSENNVPRLIEALKMLAQREDFSYFCGCAANSAIALKHGADGIVPSVANYRPDIYHQLYVAGRNGDEQTANQLQQETIEMGRVNTAGLTLGESLAGLKIIMKMCNLCEEFMLPPLSELRADIAEKIRREAKPYLPTA